jgi:hypothetical protein
MGQIRILIRSHFFCLDRAPNSIRVHWDEIVWGLNYDQAGDGGKTTSSFTIQTICRLYSFSYPSLVNTLSLSVLIRRKRAGRPASAADYYVVEVSTGEVKIIRSIHALWLESRHMLLDCFVVEVLIRRWGWCVREWTHTRSPTQRLRLTYLECIHWFPQRTVVCLSVFLCLSFSHTHTVSLSGADRTTFSPKMTKNVFRNSCPSPGVYSCSSPGLVHFFNENVS